MKLAELQRRMAADVMRPLGTGTGAAEYVKPNGRLTSMERVGIYNRQYWSRVMEALEEDFPGLRAVLGARAFRKMAVVYLEECPSRSFTLRDLGKNLEAWLREHPEFAGARFELALDMVRLEWAHIEAFDGAEVRAIGPEDLAEMSPKLRLGLQPHVRLLELGYPVDLWRARRVTAMRPEAVGLALHRVEGNVFYRRLEVREFRVLESIAGGVPLREALAGADPAQVEQWFGAWARLGWLTSRDSRRRSGRSGSL